MLATRRFALLPIVTLVAACGAESGGAGGASSSSAAPSSSSSSSASPSSSSADASTTTSAATGVGGAGGSGGGAPSCAGLDEQACEGVVGCRAVHGEPWLDPGADAYAGCVTDCSADEDCEGFVESETCAHPPGADDECWMFPDGRFPDGWITLSSVQRCDAFARCGEREE